MSSWQIIDNIVKDCGYVTWHESDAKECYFVYIDHDGGNNDVETIIPVDEILCKKIKQVLPNSYFVHKIKNIDF